MGFTIWHNRNNKNTMQTNENIQQAYKIYYTYTNVKDLIDKGKNKERKKKQT